MKRFAGVLMIITIFLIASIISGYENDKDIYIKSDDIQLNKELFNDDELDWISKYRGKEIRVGVASDYIPIEYTDKNGYPKGMGIEILRRVNKVSGLTFKIEKQCLSRSWKYILESAYEKKLDVLPTASLTEDRLKYLNYSGPYIEMTQVILGHKDDPVILNDISRVEGKTFVGPKGYWFLEIVRKESPDSKIIEVESMEDALEYISRKKADYTISDIPVFSYYKEQGRYSNIKIIGELKDKNSVHIAVRKDMEVLVSVIDKVIENTDYSELYETAFIMPQDKTRENNLLVLIALLSSILIWVIYYLYMTFSNLMQAKKDAELANRQKTMLITNISHDLRTPITVVLGYAQAIMDKQVKSEEDRDKYIARIYEKTRYLNDVVSDFFFVSRIEDRKLLIRKEEAELNGLLQNMAENMEIKAYEMNIDIVLDIDETCGIKKEIDGVKFYRAVENIISNAIRYGKGGGRVIITTKMIDESRLLISIEDDGIGIDESDIENIFKRYYKGKNSKKESIGLGLYISKEIIKSHGGEIGVESELDKGTVFRIEL